MNAPLLALAHELAARREPFALATVVRCEPPTSAKPGAAALIRADGSVTGWIGGSCAEPLVVEEALAALRDGAPRLVALVGPGAAPGARPGVREHPMSCHSGGSLDVYVEPVLPAERLVLIGAGPVLEALARLGAAAGMDGAIVAEESGLAGLAVGPEAWVVVATHGRFDEDALAHVLASEPRYVGLVASRRRAAAVLDGLRARGVRADRLARLRAPAGLDLGARSPDEIAVSILAEIVQLRRHRPPAASPAAAPRPPAASAVDPVCGMTVPIAAARHVSRAAGAPVYFCGAGCLRRFEAEPARYLPPARA